VIEHLREDCVFEVTCQADGSWRAFYRARPHYDAGIYECRYRWAEGATAAEAIANAFAGWVTEKLTS